LSIAFVKDAVERAVKTAAQTLAAALATGDGGLDILHVDWQGSLSLAGGAALLSILSSLASLRLASKGTASVVDAVSYGDSE
jgi:hypothetical protein